MFKEVRMLMNTPDHYGLIARLLHWLVAVLAIAMLAGGSLLSILPAGGFKAFVIGGHKSIGVVILVLTIGRIAWRYINPQPRALGGNPMLNGLAHLVHIFLYVLLLLQPLVGILMSQAYGYPVSVLGMFNMPPLVWQSPSLGNFFREAHGVAAVLLAGFIVIHVAAALKHHVVDRDGTLMRMLNG
jgi:cytochrome b561